MTFTAVLDAAALYPFSLRDTLLRLAELELYAPLWSAQILEEMRRSLVEDERVNEERADRLVTLMREAFEEAEVDASEISRLEPAMTNEKGDRHVLAAAVAADSELVVTFNLALVDPPISLAELLAMLERAGVPRFAEAIRDYHANRAGSS